MTNSLRFVLSGERYFPVAFANPEGGSRVKAFMGLTAREMDTLGHLCKGLSNKEIARELVLQEVTVKLHVKNILGKCGVANRTQAALVARDQGEAEAFLCEATGQRQSETRTCAQDDGERLRHDCTFYLA